MLNNNLDSIEVENNVIAKSTHHKLLETKAELQETKQLLKDSQFVTAALVFVVIMLVVFWTIANLI